MQLSISSRNHTALVYGLCLVLQLRPIPLNGNKLQSHIQPIDRTALFGYVHTDFCGVIYILLHNKMSKAAASQPLGHMRQLIESVNVETRHIVSVGILIMKLLKFRHCCQVSTLFPNPNPNLHRRSSFLPMWRWCRCSASSLVVKLNVPVFDIYSLRSSAHARICTCEQARWRKKCLTKWVHPIFVYGLDADSAWIWNYT